jgi:excisionase family DNA binding protein
MKGCALKQNLSDSCNQCSIIDADRLLTVGEVAQLICFSEKTIYQLVHRKRIPYTKISRALRFKKSDIERWIEDNTYQPQAKDKKKVVGRMNIPQPKQGSRTVTDVDRMVEQSRRKYLES